MVALLGLVGLLLLLVGKVKERKVLRKVGAAMVKRHVCTLFPFPFSSKRIRKRYIDEGDDDDDDYEFMV